MLLLTLFAGCLALCAAQTTFFPSSGTGVSTPTPFRQSVQAKTVLLTSKSSDNVVAILRTAVQSYLELNETTVAPVLKQLYGTIRQVHPDLDFSLTVKHITRV